MKQTLLFNALFMLCISVIGQNKSDKVDIKWSEELKESKKSTLSDIVGFDETGFYALKVDFKGRNTIILEHFDQKLVKTKSSELRVNENEKRRIFEDVIELNDKLFILSSFKNQKLKKNFLFIQGINKKTLQLEDNLKKIAEVSYAGASKRNSGSFNHKISVDSSKVLIYYNLPYVKTEKEKFGFHVFDSQLNELWEKKVTLPYEEKLFNVVDYQVSKTGDVYLLGALFNEKAVTKRRGKPNYKHLILGYTNNGSVEKEYVAEVEDHFLTDMKIAINDDKDIICGGFYSTKGTVSIRGSYFLKIDGNSTEIKNKSFQEFGIDFITQNMTDRQEKKAKKKDAKGKEVELYQYDLDEIILREDGGAVLVGEQYFVEVVVTHVPNQNGGTTTRTDYVYYYNDIIVINISPSGEIQWTEKIPKRQRTKNDNGFYSSYALSVVGNDLYFVFNDNPKNLLYNGEIKLKYFNRGKESLVVLVQVDEDGRQVKEALFSAKDADVLTRPLVCEQIAEKEMILFGQRKKTQRFAKLSFK